MGYKRIIRKIAKFILASQPNAFVQVNVGQIQAGNILQGKKIVITGGGSGLGYAMAKKFISEGAEVVISGRNADKLKVAAEKIGSSNCKTGAIALTILVIATVILGLDGIVNTLGKIGPIIIIMILVVSIFTAITGFPNYIANANEINKGAYSTIIEQVGNGSPLMSGASYGGFVILWFASFMAEIGSKNKLNEVNIGMSLSAIFIFGAATICCFALIGYIDIVGAADIPALVLAAQISPILAQAFAVIICAGIYTSAVPLLWTGVRKISNEGTKKYKIVTVVAGVVGCLIACFVPYKGLINILYGMNGYLGFILVFFMIIYDIKTKMSKNVKAN